MITVIKDDVARENLAANLQFLLNARDITQRELATAAERPLMSINSAIRGKSLPSVALVASIAEVIGHSMEDLIGPPAVLEAKERLRAGRKKSLQPA